MKRILILASTVLTLGAVALADPGGKGKDNGHGQASQKQHGPSADKGRHQSSPGNKAQSHSKGQQRGPAPGQHEQKGKSQSQQRSQHQEQRGKAQTQQRPQHQDQRGKSQPQQQRASSSSGRHMTPPKTGRTDNGNHNRAVSRSSAPSRMAAPPIVVRNKVINNVHITNVYRSGYTAYNPGWRDQNFWYPHYVYVYDQRSAPSPWYWYPHLPAYLSISFLRPSVSVVFSFGIGEVYAYRPHYYSRFEPDRLDIAADRLQIAFRDGDFDRMSYMVDPNVWVQIQVGDRNDYEVRGQDFRGMMRDLTHDTRTVSYDITRVRSGSGLAVVEARHVYIDPWGRREVVHHHYGLRRTPRGYVIVSFRTDLA